LLLLRVAILSIAVLSIAVLSIATAITRRHYLGLILCAARFIATRLWRKTVVPAVVAATNIASVVVATAVSVVVVPIATIVVVASVVGRIAT